MAEGFSRLLSHFVSEAAAFQTSYIGIIAASLILSLAATYLLLRTWHEESLSLVVTLLIGLLLTVGFRDHFFQPWSLLEMALYTGALAALTRRRASAVFWIAIAATLNRETGIFLGFVALAAAVGIKRMSPDLSERLRRWALLALVGGATLYLSIRGLYGFSPPIHAPGELFASNIAAANLSQALLLATCMVGGIGYFIFRGWPYAPTVIKAALWGTIPHIAALLVFGVWHEVRLLFPFMGFVATFLSFGLQQGGRGSSEPVGSMANT